MATFKKTHPPGDAVFLVEHAAQVAKLFFHFHGIFRVDEMHGAAVVAMDDESLVFLIIIQ